METTDLRKELHQYIDESDDKLVRMLYAMIKAYNEHGDEYEFTEEEIKEFDEIKEAYNWYEEQRGRFG